MQQRVLKSCCNGDEEAKAGKAPVKATGAEPTRSPTWSHAVGPQVKLTVNQPGDAYEQEADRVAEQVTTTLDAAGPMQTSAPAVSPAPSPEAGPTVHTKPAGASAGSLAPPVVQQALQSPGQPLDPATRHAMEPRFGQDFGDVRVHTDPTAAQSAAAIHARAYTVGRDVVFAAGQYEPHTAEGQRLLAHELTHVAQQREGQVTPGLLQRDIAEERLPNTPVEQIMADPTYFENGIQRIEFFSAELAILHYSDGSQIRLGLVPDQIEAPFEAVDYRTPRSAHIPVTSTPSSLGMGSIRFLPRGREARTPPGATLGQVVEQLSRTIRFTHHPNGRIVPTEVNTITAPRLCQALREAEAEYVRRFDEMAQGAIEILEALEWILILSSIVGGLAGGGARAAGGGTRAGGGRAAAGRAGAAATGLLGRAQSTLTTFFLRLWRTGATEAITVEGVGFGGVRVTMRGTELMVSRGAIVNVGRVAGQGRLMHTAFEQAAIQAARQAGARSARVALETVVNPRWAAYLESQGYAYELIEHATGFTRVLTKVFTL